MEWVLIALFLGYTGQQAHKKRHRKLERKFQRRQYEEQKEFEAFVASLKDLTPEQREAAWKQRTACIVAAQTCAVVVASSFGIF
jgi:hypothetical protein